ncbi:Penicillin-binding protein activator LpoA [BD1-7 clade bacterium]|uniref:Penicillin-binding protein activator LpoA n=1 Tax=BD1-7 clade bacterium TaxID=2029982 RepID=A0A5S9N283_9GAMM|nr:Penicillin-binding protein activator LpoA [BD1-7 clade bacterium]
MVNETRQIFLPFLLVGALALQSCSTTPSVAGSITPSDEVTSLSVSPMLDGQLTTIYEAIANADYSHASQLINSLSEQYQNNLQSANDNLALINAKASLFLATDAPEQALSVLDKASTQQLLTEASADVATQTLALTADAWQAQSQPIKGARIRLQLADLWQENKQAYLHNHEKIWQLANALADAPETIVSDPTLQQWVELAKLTKRTDIAFSDQIDKINQWQLTHPTHPAALIPVSDIGKVQAAGRQIPRHIAVLLPFDGKYKRWSNAVRDGVMQSWYKNPSRTEISFYSADPSVDFLATYDEAIADGADLIIGPLLKNQLIKLQSLEHLPVPTIALNDTNAEHLPEGLLEFSLATEDEIDSLIAKAVDEDYRRVIILSEDLGWAKDATAYFTRQWEGLGNTVLSSQTFETTRGQSPVVEKLLNIDQSHRRAREIAQLTNTRFTSEPRRRQDVDLVVVFSKSAPAQPLRPLFAYHKAGNLPMYATSNVYKGYPDPSANQDLNGMVITDAPRVIERKKDIPKKYKKSPLIRLFAFGEDAYILSQRGLLLAYLEDREYPGSTGDLRVLNQHVHRQLDYAEFKKGIPIKIEANTKTE